MAQHQLTKIILLAGTVVGLGLLMSFFVFSRPILAQEPTPTPVSQPDTVRCRMEEGADCEFERFDNIETGSTLIEQTNPPLNAQEVPTKTLVSVTFAASMVANTINSDTFFVQHETARVGGRVEYIDAGKIAVFYPNVPLASHTRYTATVTVVVRDVAGNTLPQDFVWSFETFTEPVRLEGGLSAAGVFIDNGMYVYFGDLHTHSNYVDYDPDYPVSGTPAQAFTVARANGLDFMALTGHDIYLNPTRWQDILNQASAATVNGTFIGLRGFEYTGSEGHLNVLETDTYVSWSDPRYRNLIDFYAWLVAQPYAIGEFNHPYSWLNFNNFAYYGDVDQKITLREVLYVDQTLLSLNQGWHVGTLFNSDTHTGGWGSQKYMGVVASGLNKAAILEAIRARRTFYVSPYGQRMATVMQANGYWMGSAIPNTGTINFKVMVSDPDHKSRPLNLRLYDNGVAIASARLPGASLVNWNPQAPARLGHYYYVEAYHDGWAYSGYSSPIWVERPPVANAGVTQFVRPNGTVILNGSASSDPDGDTLAYKWQASLGSFYPSNGVAPVFTAPAAPGDVSIALTVIDTGGLSDDDTTVVTVTNQPILEIVAGGPEETAPGELITYTLTITNRGATIANQVVVNNTLPAGATYVSGSGGTLTGNVVSWTLAELPANVGVTQVQYAVTSSLGVINKNYGATCPNCIPAIGTVEVWTNASKLYFPLIIKN